MDIISKRSKTIKPSPTISVMSKAQKLKASGKNIISLAAGELDFDTPDWIKQAAIQSMEQGLTRYTSVDGLPALKKAIQDKFKRQNNIHYDLSEIMVSTGGKQVLFNAMLSTLNEGDDVIIPAPYWVSYLDVVVLFGGNPVIIKTNEDENFKLTPEKLEKAITEKTKWLILNSPNNPTGSVYSYQELKDLAAVLKKYPHVHILSDDIYEHLIYGNNIFYSIINADESLKNRTLLLNGCSKAFAMTGWRIGYAAGPKHIIREMTKIQSQSTTSATSIAQGASVIALNASLSFLKDWKKELVQRRDFCVKALNDIDGIQCHQPDGAFYIYVNCSFFIGKHTEKGDLLETDTALCEYLLNYGVAVVPGSAFGLSPYFRMSFSSSLDELKEAIKRMQKAFISII